MGGGRLGGVFGLSIKNKHQIHTQDCDAIGLYSDSFPVGKCVQDAGVQVRTSFAGAESYAGLTDKRIVSILLLRNQSRINPER